MNAIALSELTAVAAIGAALILGLAIATSIVWVLVPFSMRGQPQLLELNDDTPLLQLNIHLTQQIDRGDVLVNSPEYWQAIDAMAEEWLDQQF